MTAGTEESSLADEVLNKLRKARQQIQSMSAALEQSLDHPEADTEWEQQLGGPPAEPEPTPENVPPLEPPSTEWEARRRQETSAQMKRSWSDVLKGPFRRKPWRTR